MSEATAGVDLTRSALVVAHPDDEVLWFSSILERVGRVVLCYEDCDDYPELGPGRRAVLAAYPLPQVCSLRLPEPCSLLLVDWSKPQLAELGLRLNAADADRARRVRYAQSYQALRAKLAPQLRGLQAVFTHSPWGEYGHPDHAQLASVVASLRDELGFRLFHAGYVADRTMPLAAALLGRLGRWFELPTQPALAARLQALYLRHACWTWPVDYQLFTSEVFLEATGTRAAAGSGFRLNCVTP